MVGVAKSKSEGGFGEPVKRIEDRRLVSGRGRYIDDVRPDAVAYAAFCRADVAHARIVSIDTSVAKEGPGVVDVLTGADLRDDGLGDIPCESIPEPITKGNWHRTPFPALVHDRVMAVGDPVAVVIAETKRQAADAAELIEVEYEDLPVVASLEAATAPDAPLLYEGAPGNTCFDVSVGDAEATKAAFEKAAHVVELSTRQPRLAHAPMEPRGAIGQYNPGTGRYTLTTSTQNPHSVRRLLSDNVLKVPAHKVRVVAGDVGGGFGLKGRLFPEEVVVVWASRRSGRPVKWVASRSEAFLSDFHGRDQMARGRVALDKDGRILALDVDTCHNLGCRLAPATGVSPFLTCRMICGPYAIAAASVRVRGVFSNTRSTTSYRGAGRPEATYFIERILDKAATVLGIDPVEIRRRNLVQPDQMPFKNALLDTYDCGEFEATLDKALEHADWAGFDARRKASQAAGKLRGRGLCCFVEVASISNERMEVRFDPSGRATILAGTFSHGQGHETVFTQMVSEWLGLPFDEIGFVNGDTDQIAHGGGTYASRSLTVGGSALQAACTKVIEKARRIAAWMLEVEAGDIAFDEGVFSVTGTNKTVTLSDLAKAAFKPMGFPVELGVGLEAVGYFAATPQNYPNGCHIAEVEIDPDFGTVHIDRYCAVDDVGAVANPLLLEGQLHGSIAQGVGPSLLERIVYDEHGQLITAAFTEYGMPRAHHMPDVASGLHPVPTAPNPLGVKGGAEMGTIAAPPAIARAIEHALDYPKPGELDFPALPEVVLQALARDQDAA